MQLRAGRIELTDLNINVKALAELRPDLPIRLERAHVGRLRVEISYSKLITESLAFFLDDIVVQVAPLGGDSDGTCVPDTGFDAALKRPQVTGALGADVTGTGRRSGAGGTAASGTVAAGTEFLDEEEQSSEGGDRLDFLAQWIEQITSKVKIVVNNLTIRIGSSVGLEDGDSEAHSSESKPFLELRYSYLKWCDETPESAPFMAETPSLPQSAAAGIDRAEGASKTGGGMVFAHKVKFYEHANLETCRRRVSPRTHVTLKGLQTLFLALKADSSSSAKRPGCHRKLQLTRLAHASTNNGR